MSRNGNCPVATAYRYDQLNRLKSVYSYNGINMSGNSWSSGSLQNAWREQFKYDANGNIKSLKRYSATGVMDNLTYNYKSGTNQLTSVDETVASGDYADDVDDQNNNNYIYDPIGNLTKDKAEQIDSIYWNVYGKIRAIKRTTGSTRAGLNFEYDAGGQRVLKVVKNSDAESDWNYTWYVRDAQGNVMATYTKKSLVQNGDTSLYRKLNKALVENMNSDSLATFIKHYFTGSQFTTALAQAVADRGMFGELIEQYNPDSLLDYNSTFAQQSLQNLCMYYSSFSLRKTIDSLIWKHAKDSVLGMISQNCLNTSTLVQNMLAFDGTNNYLLNALATYDVARINTIYSMLGGPPFPPKTTAQKITYIRGFPDAVVASNITMQFNVQELETNIKGLNAALLDSTFIARNGRYNDCNLINSVGNCDYDTTWYGFVRNYMPDSIIWRTVVEEGDPFYITSLLLTKDRLAMNKIADVDYNVMADALRGLSGLEISDYLTYIYKRFGRTMFNNILSDFDDTIKIQRTLTLDELHIYGSSRHGIYKPKRQLEQKRYAYTSLESDGTIDLSAAIDSSSYAFSYHYFKRTLSYKQYELSNHLGNVLATVLDRKTAQIDTTGADTLLYYSADVSTAGLYYAFGSSIAEMQYTSNTAGGYRYGFNNQEKDSELGEYYAFEYRIHDARLGRFLSVDPNEKKYPWNSNYSFAINSPIKFFDNRGLDPEPTPIMNIHLGRHIKPSFKYDNGFLDTYYDENGVAWYTPVLRKATAKEKARFLALKIKAWGGKLIEYHGLDDGLSAYKNFLRGKGEDFNFNLSEYFREDPSGKEMIESYIGNFKSFVQTNLKTDGDYELYTDGLSASYDKSKSYFKYPSTENWQKAIGAFNTYAFGDVNVETFKDEGLGLNIATYTMTITIYAEDMYNFNPGQSDIATGKPDSDNGIFEVTGLAKQFMQYGFVSVSVQWCVDLNTGATLWENSSYAYGTSESATPNQSSNSRVTQ